jgi:phosphomannomutase
MLPDVHIGRDAPVAAALTLMHLALFDGTISQLKKSLPQWEIVKLKVFSLSLFANLSL